MSMPTKSVPSRTSLAVLVLASRVAVFIAGFVAVTAVGMYAGASPPRPTTPNVFLDLPARWDTGWYVGVASGGYRWDGQFGRFENIAFFPLYPHLLRAAAWLTRSGESVIWWNWSGVGLSIALFCTATRYLYLLGTAIESANVGAWAVIFAATYPFAVYFSLPYTESLFLLGSVAACYYFWRRQFVLALLAAICVGLTRPNGNLLVVALAGLWLEREWWPNQSRWREQWPEMIVSGAVVMGPLMGMAVYSAFIYGLTGHPFAWAIVQEGWGRSLVNPLTALLQWLRRLLLEPSTMPLPELLNGAFGILAISLALPIARRLGLGFGAFVALGVIVPVTVGGVPSLGRYTAALFPIFLYAATVMPRRWLSLVAALGMAMQLAIAGMFFTWWPVY